MYPDISTVLGDHHEMFYHPAWPSTALQAVCTLDQVLQTVNHAMFELGTKVTHWPAPAQDAAIRLVLVNWVYQRLSHEPIRKPILAYAHQQQLIVDCGDTRLMSLALCEQPTAVPVLVTVDQLHRDRYQSWQPVRCNQDLIEISGFAPDAVILFTTCAITRRIDWLEIGDHSTSHHMHDQEQRLRMINNYLESWPGDQALDRSWCRSAIPWYDYDR